MSSTVEQDDKTKIIAKDRQRFENFIDILYQKKRRDKTLLFK